MDRQLHSLLALLERGGCSLVSDSREVIAGSVFVALPAPQPYGASDVLPGGEVYAEKAASAGARAIVCDQRVANVVSNAVAAFPHCVVVAVPSARKALGVLAQKAFPQQQPRPRIIGLTGTNGKTTTTYLLEHILTHSGKKVGIIGTVAYRWPEYHEDAPLTTPGCVALHSLLSRMSRDHVDYAVMEVSSHALDQDRVGGLDFSAALLTNLTQDHLDYHPAMEHYFQAKARLFRPVQQRGLPLDDKVCVCNADDPFSIRLLQENPQAIGFGLHDVSSLSNRFLLGRILDHSPAGLHLGMSYEGMEWDLRVPLVGTFNAMNLLGAQAVALGLGFAPERMQSLEDFPGVPGRLQPVSNNRGISAFVDYAHTPDALINVLSTLRDAGFKRVITVFGCGGNRDAKKRPLMGEAVARYSDIAVLTSDNPRNEDPSAILADVRPGLKECKTVFEEVDRHKAIVLAASMARPGDALLVAGKGHETYQIIQDEKIDFDDVKELMGVLG